MLALESAGSGTLSPNAVIPASRTSSPYSLTDAIGDLTTNTAGTNTDSLNQSLDTLADTLRACEIDEARWPSFERALSSLNDSEMLHEVQPVSVG